MRRARCQLFVSLALALVTGCSVVNAIDVCSRGQAEERQVNLRTEGDQAILSSNALAVLPQGNALVVYSSNRAGEDVDVRWRVVDATGTPRPTCEEPSDYTYEPPAGAPVPGKRFAATVAGPMTEGEAGLVTFVATDAVDLGAGRQLWAQPINTTPCPEDEPFLVRDPGTGSIGMSTTVGLSDQKFVVIWEELPGGPTEGIALMARVLQYDTWGLEALETVPAPDGEAVSIAPEDRTVASPSAVAIGDLELAVAWLGFDTSEIRVWLAVLDDRLTARVAPRIVARQPRQLGATGRRLALATDDDGLLVVWSVDMGDETHAFGLVVSQDGEQTGEPFALGAAGSTTEDWPVAVGLSDGGYLVAWQSLGNPRHEDQSRYGIRVRVLERDGSPRFANPACGTDDFQLNRITDNDQIYPGLARLPDGTVLSVWSDQSGQLDPAGLGLVHRMFKPRELLPLE